MEYSKTPKEIELYLREEKAKFEKQKSEPKLLILGPSDSGKSTFLKQIKLLYGKGFSKEDQIQSKRTIINNIIHAIDTIFKLLMSYSIHHLDNLILEPSSRIQFQLLIDQLLSFRDNQLDYFSQPILEAIVCFWNCDYVQKIYHSLNDNAIPTTTSYFFQHVQRITSESGMPTNEDLLMIRVITKSVSDTVFTIDGINIHFYDVSGLVHHRKQWISYFEDVLNVIFIVSLSSYDQMMIEDESKNRLMDSIHLFEYIFNHPLLKKADVILFFNKKDLFEIKIRKISFKKYFPDFRDRSLSEAYTYTKEKFKKIAKDSPKTLFTHLTCCTDTKAMKSIISDIM
ncbi:guanine nucleotide binding protein, alpha subunit [Globomyces pollinis-pini]|nr:guanine nucleotide binding protein, alpha subunit [Globomyces pollinis-pini]